MPVPQTSLLTRASAIKCNTGTYQINTAIYRLCLAEPVTAAVLPGGAGQCQR